MKDRTDEGKGISRRDFVKGAAAGVGVAAVAAEGGWLRAQAEEATAKPKPPEDLVQGVPSIAASQIKERVTADIVVVGAGISGFCASLSAAEAGAKVVQIEKGAHYTARGFDNGCIDSKVHKAAGVKLDKEEIIDECLRCANYRVDQRLLRLWADNSGAAMDWLVDHIQTEGMVARLNSDKIFPWGPYKHYPTAVCFPDAQGNVMGGNVRIMPHMEKLVKAGGVDLRYQHPAVQLVRVNGGRVTAVVAKNPAGDYTQFSARKGIILCSGGYDNSPEMMKKYLRPSDLRIRLYESPNKVSTGDGHNMGLAIGADMDEPPHVFMVGSGTLINNENFYLLFHPFLRVDKLGQRYMNENVDYCRQANATSVLPGHFNWTILDGNWKDSLGEEYGRESSGYVASLEKQMNEYIGEHFILKADTVEDLARAMKADPAAFRATVDRYNELAKLKQDPDFGKSPEHLVALDKAPYYAINTGAFSLVTVSGLKINTKLQILDLGGNPIPGLYGAGNVTGGFFSDTYPRNVGGISHGRAITFGRLAALSAVAEKG